ncbi:hypothetical protein [Nostoc sp.]|uniref:hypothetical protein n=1 Tax=Nostoc sp. TaxID=1180 RepID=UPI002FF7CB34
MLPNKKISYHSEGMGAGNTVQLSISSFSLRRQSLMGSHCGESSTVGGFPGAGDWRTRKGGRVKRHKGGSAPEWFPDLSQAPLPAEVATAVKWRGNPLFPRYFTALRLR